MTCTVSPFIHVLSTTRHLTFWCRGQKILSELGQYNCTWYLIPLFFMVTMINDIHYLKWQYSVPSWDRISTCYYNTVWNNGMSHKYIFTVSSYTLCQGCYSSLCGWIFLYGMTYAKGQNTAHSHAYIHMHKCISYEDLRARSRYQGLVQVIITHR